MRTFWFRLVCLVLLSFPVLGQKAEASPAPVERRNILVLNTYHMGLPIPDSIDAGLLAAARAGGFTVGDVFLEHLDFIRVASAEHRANVASMLRHKLAGKRIDIVVAIAPPAIDFVAREGRALFPKAAIMAVIAPDIAVLRDDPRSVIHLPWQVDPAGSLRAALELFPQTRRVLVVTGAKDGVLPFLDGAKRAFLPWQDKLQFEYTNTLTYEEMLQRVYAQPADSIILYSYYFNDVTGRAFVPVEVVGAIARNSPVPVFAVLAAYLERGAIGGSLLHTQDIGKQAGQLALDYLRGDLALKGPVTTFNTHSQMMFDWNELTRWQARVDHLPPNSTVVNRPPSLWAEHRETVVVTLLAFAAMGALLVALTVLNRRLKRSKEEVHQLNAELENRVHERTAQLEAAIADLEGFSYSVSHDLRAPLRAIDGFSLILREDYAPQLDAEGQRLFKAIGRNAQRMGQLIDDILAFSRAGRDLSLEALDMRVLTEAVWRELEPQRVGRNVEFTIESLPPCRGDAAAVGQVLQNLLANAIKFTAARDPAVIVVSGSVADGMCTYCVKDNGAGFDPAFADKLFGLFQRMHSAKEFEGTGVGLAIVKRFVVKLGGAVGAHSQPDAGATFWFSLPAV